MYSGASTADTVALIHGIAHIKHKSNPGTGATPLNTRMHHPAAAAVSWEELSPSSFKTTLYVPSLKISITPGSFILYSRPEMQQPSSAQAPPSRDANNEKGLRTSTLEGQSGEELNKMSNCVGRIIKVVNSVEEIDNFEHFASSAAFPDDVASLLQQPADVSVQYVKVNVFRDQSVISNKVCLDQSALSQASNGKSTWQRLVQLCKYDWIPSSAVVGLAFVFPEADNVMLPHTFDDCRGMYNAYLLKYRIDTEGHISCIPSDSCPPFPSCLKPFCKLWSVDHCQMIFNSIRQIRQDMQRSLCRVAQSQGDFSVKTTKIQLPSCSWFYIKSSLASEGIQSIPAVSYTQPKSVLTWGLTLYSCPQTGSLDVIRFDTKEKMDGFRRLFGIMSGFGVRKKRPRYRDGKSLLSLNDVLNVITCPSQEENDSTNENRNSTECVDHGPFKRFGTTDDGIDLAYDASEGVLQIVLRYRKLVVTNMSIGALASVGVATCADGRGRSSSLQNPSSDCSTSSTFDCMIDIAPGMEFVDDMYVMRVQKVFSNEIHAKRVHKIVDQATKRTMSVHSSEIVIYTDAEDVHLQIQKMLQ